MELEEYAKQREAERAIFEKVMRPDRTADVLRAIVESDGQMLTKVINDGLVVMTENAALTVTEKGLAAIDADDANEAAMFDEMARENEREIFEGRETWDKDPTAH